MFDSAIDCITYDYPPPADWHVSLRDLGNVNSMMESQALDLGCGPGRFLEPLSVALNTNVYGADFSQIMLDAAKKNTGGKFALVLADAEQLPFRDRCFDFVLLRYILHHIRDRQQIIDEVARILKLGGFAVVETSDVNFLKSHQDYIDFPEVGRVDLARWPLESDISKLMSLSGMEFFSSQSISLIREKLPLNEYLERLEKWKCHGGGTSFRKLFSSEERERYVSIRRKELKFRDVNYVVPIMTNSVVMNFRKSTRITP